MVLRLLIAFLLLTAPAKAALFKPAVHTLPNGMQIMVVENHRAPVVLHMLWYKVGSADEPANHAGVAHFLEHMMFKGTDEHPDQDYSADIAALGGEDNAFTSYDYTAFFARVHPRQLETVMRMEAERITTLELNDDDIRVERDVVQQERAQRDEDTAESRFAVAVNRAFHGTHPYARPIIGYPDTISAYAEDTIRPFYEAHYAPNNVIAIIVGDVRAADVFALADTVYGPLVPRPVPPRVRTGTVLAEPLRITRAEAEVQQPQLHLMWPAVSAHQNSQDSLALQVLTEVLTSPDGTLQQDLVFKNDIAVGVDVSYDSDRLNGSVVTLSASPRPGVSMTKLENALLASWHRALGTLDDAAVKRAKQRLLDSATLARDGIHTPAYAFGMALTTGQSVADVENWPQNIAAVTTAAVRRVAQPLTGTARLTAQLLPAAEGKKP